MYALDRKKCFENILNNYAITKRHDAKALQISGKICLIKLQLFKKLQSTLGIMSFRFRNVNGT